MQETQLSLKLKEEENLQLNELIGKLSKTLNDEREHLSTVKSELDELKLYYVELNEKNNALISQLEADNAEIKKRLVKLIKEKAELWQKADNLEYQNLLKASSMWMDDANVTNCMNCNSHFSLILRKVIPLFFFFSIFIRLFTKTNRIFLSTIAVCVSKSSAIIAATIGSSWTTRKFFFSVFLFGLGQERFKF